MGPGATEMRVRDPEIEAITAKFRDLASQTRALALEIDATVTTLDIFQKLIELRDTQSEEGAS